MKTVGEILKVKGNRIWSVSPDSTIYEALQLMAEKEIGALLVLSGENNIEGIISERDYARKVILKGKSSKDTPAKEIMSTKVIYVNSSNEAEECMALMINKRVRHLPVIDNSELSGIISIGDVVKAVIDDKEVVIHELENYITGRR